MTTFGDQLYHHGGVPVCSGAGVPNIFSESNYYYVDKATGLAGNTGRSVSEPLSTIAAAITLMNARINWSSSPWSRNDVLVIGPGKYDETLTSLPYGCTVIGSGDSFDLDGERSTIIYSSTGSAFDGTSVINCGLHNLCFLSSGANPTFEVDNFNRNVVTHCQFAGNTGDTTTNCFEVVKDMTGNRISDCVFHRAAYGMYINTDNANSKQASGNIIEDCYITGCTSAGIYFDANTVPSFTVINRCNIGDGSGTTLALGLDDNTAAVAVYNTNFVATACDPASGAGNYNGCYLNGSLMT